MMTRSLFPSLRYLKAISAVYGAVAAMGALGLVTVTASFAASRHGANIDADVAAVLCAALWALLSRRGRHRILGWFPGGDLNALREEHRLPARSR